MAEVTFVCPYQGYAKSTQTTSGIHTRLYARAFILSETGDDRWVLNGTLRVCCWSCGLSDVLDGRCLQQSVCVCELGCMHGVTCFIAGSAEETQGGELEQSVLCRTRCRAICCFNLWFRAGDLAELCKLSKCQAYLLSGHIPVK